MSKKKYDGILFTNPVKKGYLEDHDFTFYYLNGSAGQHNALSKMVADEKKRQQGWEEYTRNLICDEDGNPIYIDMKPEEFTKKLDRAIARDIGMIIAGIKKSEEQSDFDEEVEKEVKNSPKAKEG